MILQKYEHKKYNREGIICYKDPIRNILIQATPEEQVRQDVVKVLTDKYGYPSSTLNTEYLIKLKRRNIRADIVIWLPTDEFDEDGRNIEQAYIIIECKNSKVPLTQEAFIQAETYCNQLGAEYMVVTNGKEFWIYRYNEKIDTYEEVENIPSYVEALQEEWIPKNPVKQLSIERPSYELLNNPTLVNEQYKNLYANWIIGLDTPEIYRALIIDLYHLLLSPTSFIPFPVNWLGYTFCEDLGVSLHNFGNAAGGQFYGEYRSFLVRDKKGNDIIIRFMICATAKTKNDPRFGTRRGTTYLNVAVCDGEKMHNSLQLSLDDYLSVYDKDTYLVQHDGRMTAGKRGRVKNQKVLDFLLEKEPILIKNSKVYLGTIPRRPYLEWEEIKEVFFSCSIYALLRDDLRSIISFEK